MTFRLSWDPAALRDMKALPLDVQRRVATALLVAVEDPVRHFRRMRGTTASRLRVGDHRVIADVDRSRSIVVIHAVGHRRNVYD